MGLGKNKGHSYEEKIAKILETKNYVDHLEFLLQQLTIPDMAVRHKLDESFEF